MKSAKLSFTPKIASPCEESWAALTGGVRERHCELCDRQVHNLAAMTPAEIERLVVRSGGKLCARITRREDGSLVTLEAQPRTPLAAQIVVSASLMIGVAGAAAQSGVKQAPAPQAILTGKVMRSDGAGPLDGATITSTR